MTLSRASENPCTPIPLRRVVYLLMPILWTNLALSQVSTCGLAVQQLQGYVTQVNVVANAEFNQGIPVRCGGNPPCMQSLLMQLNAWYAQQAGLVNTWYMQLAQQCTSQTPAPLPMPASQSEIRPRLGDGVIEDLQVDDEDRTVRIRIPSTPSGFR